MLRFPTTLSQFHAKTFLGGDHVTGYAWQDSQLDPDNRVLLQVTLDDAAQADELFTVLMGEDVEARRSFIQRNAKDVRFLDI